jgi:hypothetical protein
MTAATTSMTTAAPAPLSQGGGSVHEHQHHEKSYVLFHVCLLETMLSLGRGSAITRPDGSQDASGISREFQPRSGNRDVAPRGPMFTQTLLCGFLRTSVTRKMPAACESAGLGFAHSSAAAVMQRERDQGM